jgi:hypothetical protein
MDRGEHCFALARELGGKVMNRQAAIPPNRQDRGSSSESLYERVARAKNRWLKRVMLDSNVSSTEKCFAYLVADRLNCVTLDAWPGQLLIARDLGGRSIKTAQRAARGLEKRGHLNITRDAGGSYRYAPMFLPGDEDKSAGFPGQSCPSVADKIVNESYLGIQSNLSLSTGAQRCGAIPPSPSPSNYNPRMQGTYQVEIAKMLGKNGFEILMKLNEASIERLCRAYANGELWQQELIAAQLAAKHLPKRRST